jgi:hypothetical protein
MSNNRLSFIVPNFNHALYLRRCINSIALQSRPPDELLICDDSSTDESVTVISEMARQHPRIRLIQNSHNQGVMATLRKLYNDCTGDYVTSCGADDELCPGFLSKAMEIAQEYPSAGMILARMTNRKVDTVSGAVVDSEVVLGRSCFLSPQEFQSAPAFLHSSLGHGISVACIFRKEAILEALELSAAFGPQSDIFERLFVGCKYGAALVDVPGSIFYATPNGYSRRSGIESAISTTKSYVAMLQMMSREDLRQYFPSSFVARCSRLWTTLLFGILDKNLTGGYHLATQNYLAVFERLGMPGFGVGRILAKFTALGRIAQRGWLYVNVWILMRQYRNNALNVSKIQ